MSMGALPCNDFRSCEGKTCGYMKGETVSGFNMSL